MIVIHPLATVINFHSALSRKRFHTFSKASKCYEESINYGPKIRDCISIRITTLNEIKNTHEEERYSTRQNIRFDITFAIHFSPLGIHNAIE
jgi:hypothetical protein